MDDRFAGEGVLENCHLELESFASWTGACLQQLKIRGVGHSQQALCLLPASPDTRHHMPQWSTEPYCSNAAALLALLDDFLAGAALAPPGASLAPSGTALVWASDPGAASAAGDGSIPAAAWQELGAVSRVPHPAFSGRLLLAAWRFLDRLHSSGTVASEASSPLAAAAALLRPHRSSSTGGSRRASTLQRSLSESGDEGEGAAVETARLLQQRGMLLLQRLLLFSLQHAPPEMAQQAAAQAAQVLPLLLADAAGEASVAEAVASQLQLLLAAVVQCYQGLASRATVAAQQEQLSLLSHEQVGLGQQQGGRPLQNFECVPADAALPSLPSCSLFTAAADCCTGGRQCRCGCSALGVWPAATVAASAAAMRSAATSSRPAAAAASG